MAESTLAKSVKDFGDGLKTKALQHYIELLSIGDSANARQRESLGMAAHTLGKSADDVARDHAVIARVAQLRAAADRVADLASAAGAARSQANQLEVDQRAAKAKMDTAFATAKDNAATAEKDLANAKAAGHDLESLKAANAELFPK
jgi:hypothetical protein